ncbi:hypothetical protein AZSI13_18190 [Azospira sp. I13]|uniref:TolC family protein n=1 Tax=Azospira sp. I13 TaxID=1765050 RepID=UPI000D44ED88|nr:TolC family protein [Azospira sp. I13]GBG02492.1 hypothetical protein AZSI13_18190 [Azospira sp. I13]
MGALSKLAPLAGLTWGLSLSLALQAAEPPPLAYPADLPPREAAITAIRSAPQARAAESMLAAEGENRKRLEAGPYEWTARVGSQRRNVNGVNGAPNERYREWSGGIERGIRLPGKAALDEQLGANGETMAQAALGDALHETGRLLLRTWFLWLREQENAAQWQRQSESLARQRQVTARRVQLGDAPRLELMQAEAAAAQAQAALEQARLRRQVAEVDLAARFPGLPLPRQVAPGEPQPLETLEWREHLLEHNHELMLARAESQQARLVAHRADADRLPDPTLGVHIGSDKGGEERLAGVSISIPFSGTLRSATARRDAAYASAAASREAATLARINAEAAALLASAQAAYESWRLAEEAARRIEQAATLMARAYQLGEAGIAELLTAQRQANDARLAANQSRLDALESRYRVYLDSHGLWPVDGEHEHEEK